VWTFLKEASENPLSAAVDVRRSRRWSFSLAFSLALHCATLLFVLWQVPAIFVQPRVVARGQAGSSIAITEPFYLPKTLVVTPATAKSQISFPIAKKRPEAKARKRSNVLEKEKPTGTTEVGSLSGSSLDGDSEGDDIRQGFAITFPPPQVGRWEIPNGREGDVVVELTIDAQGTVVEERVLQGMSHEIDERVIAILRSWRFRPATRNGTPIPFKYDARFHFPS